MLKEQLTELINTLYEAEGLVDMALRRDVAADDRVLYLALAKCHDVSRKAAEINVGTTAEQAEESAPVYSAAALPAADNAADNAADRSLDDEVAQRVQSGVRKPIIRAFSINDKYRYRRALFDGNDMLMRDTLAEFETMAGYGEALDYCVQTLGWDVDNGEAKGFVAILEKYYNS